MAFKIYACFRATFYGWMGWVILLAAKSILLPQVTPIPTTAVFASSISSVSNPFLPQNFKQAAPLEKADWVLRGTLVTGDESRAVLEEVTSGRQVWVKEGEELQGSRVKAIRRNHLVLSQAGSETELELHMTVDIKQENSLSAMLAAEKSSPAVEQIDEREFLVNRPFLQMLTRKMPTILETLELILLEIDTGPQGYLVSAGPQLESMAGLGLQDGDLIKSINGKVLNTEKDLIFALNELTYQETVQIEIDRNEKKLTYVYHVQP